MTHRILLLLCFALGTAGSASNDPALTGFLASGFRRGEFTKEETEIFVREYGNGILAVHQHLATLTFEQFEAEIIQSLKAAVQAATGATEAMVSRYGVEARESHGYDLGHLLHPHSRLRRQFMEAAWRARDGEEVFLSSADDYQILGWMRSERLHGRQIPLVDILGKFPPHEEAMPKHSFNVELHYPTLTQTHRKILRARFRHLYQIATGDRSTLKEAEEATHELIWWMLATVYFEKGTSSIAKGMFVALTLSAYKVTGTMDDIDLVAMRSTRKTFQKNLSKRFVSVWCNECSCALATKPLSD